MPISNSDISIGYEKISNYIKSIADGSKNVTDILNNLSDVVKKTNRDITGSLADTLGLTNKDKLGKLGSKWVQNYKKSLQERQESYGFTFYEGAIDPALINKKYATGSLAKEKISEYNQLIRQLKSEDVTISGQANDSIQNLIESLKKSNSELGTYLENARNAVKDDEGNDNIESLQELNDEDFMSIQREEIKKILSGGGVRQVIEEYNALSDASGNVSNDQQIMIDALRGTDDALADFLEQNPSATMGQYARAQAVATLETMALEAATAALNAAISFGLSVAFQALTTGIMSVINRYNDLREANMEAADSFKETSDSIQGQIDKIRELQKVVENETSTSNELYDARSDLLDIQRDIVNTYGDQAKSIDLVNGKLDEEIERLNELERKEAAKALASMDEGSYKHDKKVIGTNSHVLQIASGHLYNTSTSASANEHKKIAKQYEKILLDNGFTKSKQVNNNGYYNYITTDNTKDYINKLVDIQSELEAQTSQDDKNTAAYKFYYQKISDAIARINTEKYQEQQSNVESYALTTILASTDYRPLYQGLEAAAADYDEAVKSGNKKLEEESLNRIEYLQEKISEFEIDDEFIIAQFDDVIDNVQNDLNKREFKIKITQKDDKFNSRFLGMGNRATSTNDYFRTMFKDYSDVDIERIGLSGGTVQEEEAYKKLTELADEYEISVDEAIDVLVELGIVFSRDADAAKYTTTNYASMLEEVEKTTEGLDKFVSAQEKVATGSALTADEVNELIKLDGSLASSVERTANGYVISSEKLAEARAKYINEQKESLKEDIAASERQLKNVQYELAINQKIVNELGSKSDLTDDEKRKLNDAKAIVENRLEDEKATTEQLEQQKLLLGQIISPLEDYAAMFKDVAGKAESVTDKLAQMKSGQYKTGVIDPTDVLDFINEVPDWQNYVEINNGKATLKDTSGEALKEYIKQTSGYYDVSEKLNDKLKERNELQDKINNFKATNIIDSPNEVKMLDDMNEELNILNGTIDISEKEFEALNAILDVFFGKIEKKPAITDFEDEISKLNHKKSLGMSEDAWAGEYATIANNYLNDLEALAAEGDTDALSKVWEIKEQLYQNGIDKTQRAFDDKKLIIDNAREDLQMSVLEYRDAYAALNEAYYAPGTDLGNTEDGKKQYAENLREIEKLSSDAYDNIISRFQSSIDFGKIIDPNIINDLADVFKGQELPDAVAQVIQKGIETGIWNATDLATVAPYLTEALLAGSDVNSEAYQNAINQQKDYVISAFEDEKTQLENQLDAGLISSSQFIDGLTELWKTHYKDKKEFAEEDLQTQKDILEAQKNQIQEQIDALEAYSETQTEPYQAEIDALNEVKDKYSEVMDEKIDALQKQKDALDKINEEQERENDLLEKKKALEKASIKNRIVLTNNGWEARRDEEAYNEAKKEYEDAKKTEQTELLEQQIEALQNEKEAREKSIEKEITARENAISKIEAPINNLTKVLAALIAEQHNIDPQFIAQLLDSESGETAITALNKAMGFGQQQELKYGIDANNDLLTNETAQNIAKDVEKRNKTTNEAAKSIGLDLGGSSSANKTEQKAENPIISDLINQWNTFQSELAKMPANFGEDGHKGKVDYNHRTAVLHDTEGDYGTLYGTTLTYADMAKIFEQYLVEQEKQGKIINESIWDISEALWKKAEELPDGAFNMTPFKPNGESVVDLNSDNFDDEMYNYVISQLAQGIRLEDMDTFMGGDYATIDEADKAAQQMHEDNASLYDQGKDILLQLVLLGYDINKLQGAAYDGTPVDAETANKNLTDALKENTTATKGNSSATENNSTAITTNTKATKSSSDATTANTTAVTDGAVEIGKYALKGNEDDGTTTKEPILDSKGNFVSNKSVKALSHSDWAKKHKVSEWAPDGKHVNENMTMEQYEQLKKGQKNKIIPASIVDIADITDAQLKQFLEAIQSNTKITPQNVSPATTATTATAAEAINQNVNNAPNITMNVNIEGSADKKTVQAFKTELHNELCEYTDQLYNSLHNSFIRQKNKK